LGLNRNSSLSLDIQFVENLFVHTGLDSTGELQQPIGEGAFAMIDVGDNAKVAIPVDRNCSDPLLEIRIRGAWRRLCSSIPNG
jgi:hypothetical protein